MLRGWVVAVKVLPMRYASGQITRGDTESKQHQLGSAVLVVAYFSYFHVSPPHKQYVEISTGASHSLAHVTIAEKHGMEQNRMAKCGCCDGSPKTEIFNKLRRI